MICLDFNFHLNESQYCRRASGSPALSEVEERNRGKYYHMPGRTYFIVILITLHKYIKDQHKRQKNYPICKIIYWRWFQIPMPIRAFFSFHFHFISFPILSFTFLSFIALHSECVCNAIAFPPFAPRCFPIDCHLFIFDISCCYMPFDNSKQKMNSCQLSKVLGRSRKVSADDKHSNIFYW